MIKILTANNSLPDIIQKNPEHFFGLYVRPIKKGTGFLNIISPNNVKMDFFDYDGTSYDDRKESNQINTYSIESPRMNLELLSTFLPYVMQKDYSKTKISWRENKTVEELDTNTTTLIISPLSIDSNWYRDNEFLLSRYFDCIKVNKNSREQIVITIVEKNIVSAINMAALTLMFIAVTNKEYWAVTDNLVNKYLTIMENVGNIPYFVCYLFAKRMFVSENIYDKYVERLNAVCKENDVEIKFGDTHKQRIQFAKELLGNDSLVIDLGCGEARYSKIFDNYIGVDKDENVILRNVASGKNGNYHDCSITDYHHTSKCNIVCSEVIEHTTKEETIAILNHIQTFDFDTAVITTPNKDFNCYYQIDKEGVRHWDHKYELTQQEFIDLISDTFKDKEKYILDFRQVGDKVNGISPTSAAIIKKRHE